MSLESPTIIERITAWPYFRIALPIAGLVGVLLIVLFAFDRCGQWSDQRDTDKRKGEIANTAKEIANISNTISNLEVQKAEKQGELNRDMERLQKDLFGLDEAKKETNQALANFNRAVATNSNVNRSAADLEEVLRRLDQ